MTARRAGFLPALCLAACATSPGPGDPVTADQRERLARAAYVERQDAIATWEAWGFSGRLSMDDGEDGGSGRLDWAVRGGVSTLEFRGALGQGAWKLVLDPDGATLSKADGSVLADPSVGDLVRRETGWRVPVDALGWWVRGLAEPGHPAQFEFGDAGTQPLVALSQLGWHIRYDRYREDDELLMPSRLEATRDNGRVKLAISRWWHQAGDERG